MRKRNSKIPNDVDRYVEHSIIIAKQINDILRKLGKNQSYLAESMKKSESEISKWMGGTHNFTLKTISKIESVLNEKIILCPREIDKAELKMYVFKGDCQYLVKKKDNQKLEQEGKHSLFFPAGKSVFSEECLTPCQ